MKLLYILFFLFVFNFQTFSQSKDVLYPMNWAGISLARTIDADNLIFDFEIKRKIYKTNKIELNLTFNLELPFELIGNKEISYSDYNNKYGLSLESNFILSQKSYFGIGLQFEKYTSLDKKIFITPRLAKGFVLDSKKHIVLEFFIEYNKVYVIGEDENPAFTVKQVYEEMDYRITLGAGFKKSIFHRKDKWAKHKKNNGVIQTL